MEQEVLTCQSGHYGSRNNASRSREEETRERLSSLIRQNGLTGGRDDCCWVLLSESSTDRFGSTRAVAVLRPAHNDDFQLVAVGSAAASEDEGCEVFWPEAKDLAFVLHKIMRKKRNAANDSEEIVQESAIRGLLIYHLFGCEARFRKAEDEFWVHIPRSSVASSVPSLELEMQMLSRVLKPPSVLAAVSPPSLLARGHLDNTAASSSSAPLELAAAPTHFGFITRSSGGRGRNGGGGGGGVPPALIEFLIRRLWHDYDLEAQQRRLEIFLALANSNLEAGGQAHRDRVAPLLPAATAAPVQEPSEVTKRIKGVMMQALAAFLPACVTTFPQLKDAPDHVKFTVFGGLAFITMGFFVGTLSRSVARRGLAFRLLVFSAIAVLTFGFASQFSSPIYIALTAVVGVVLNLLIMLLRF